MAVVVTFQIPTTVEDYDRVNEAVDPGSNPPEGLIVHAGMVVEGGVRVIDIWENEAQFHSFREQRLQPAMAEALGEEALAEPPQIEVLEAHDLFKP
jgi:hypothetical protein